MQTKRKKKGKSKKERKKERRGDANLVLRPSGATRWEVGIDYGRQ